MVVFSNVFCIKILIFLIQFTETCRCPKVLYSNYRLYEPYVMKRGNMIDGIFSPVPNMIKWACGHCEQSTTSLNLANNGKGKRASKTSVVSFLEDIDDLPQISFPVAGNNHIVTYRKDFAYIHFVDSPGLILVTILDPPGVSSQFLFSAVFACYPMFLISVCMMIVAGFVVWALVSLFVSNLLR